MGLADFIELRAPVILAAWDAFAATLLPAAAGASQVTLRDHAGQVLQAIVQDLRTSHPPSRPAQAVQLATMPDAPGHTAAQTHAVLRAAGGFTMRQMVAEYRALRAGVLQRWFESEAPGTEWGEDVIRFNQAIDQAIAESVEFFSREVEHRRDIFLAEVGHDLRSPLNALLLSARLVARLGDGTPVGEPTARLLRGGERMRELIDNLLDYSRTALDLGLVLQPTALDLADVCREEVELQQTALPGCRIDFVVEGTTRGCWDASRMKQLVSNLVNNAARYGNPGGPVVVKLMGTPAELTLSVENAGPTIPSETIDLLFEPLRRGANSDPGPERASMGLGLFIVRQVAQAHGGTVAVESANTRTVFTVVLPRAPHAGPHRPQHPSGR